jgi:hypothetical protein
MAPTRRPTKAATHKIGEFNLVSKFPGYNARGDITTLDPGTLIPGSQNVLVSTNGRVASVDGYTLDGTGSSVADSGILSNFDFNTFNGALRNLRAGFLTIAGNDGKLQYRYVSGGTVHWVDLKTALANVHLSFCEFWDNTNLVKAVLWVDGSNNIFQWNGAVSTIASATAPVAGVISTINATPTAGGTGYIVGDILTITTGGSLASVKVTSITGGGIVAGLSLYEPGTGGYTVGTGRATTGGLGTGCTVEITAIATLSSVTKQGTNTWAQDGFQQGSGAITIGGASGSYTGQGSGSVLMGVNANFSANAASSIVHQTPITNALSGLSGILATFAPTVIGCGRNNQVYLGSKTSNNLYISRVNNLTSFTFSTPRAPGEGGLIPLDAPPTTFISLENRTDESSYDMYVSEGTDRWAVIRGTLSADLTAEKLEHIRLKVAPLQGALSGRLVSKMKNHIIFVGHDNVANFFGYLSYQYVPELVDFSWPIIDDMDGYDLSDASIYYNKNYIYLAVPKAGLVRVYNMTNQTQQQTSSIRGVEDVDADQPWFWEAPLTYPLSGFYWTDDKGLCGHSYAASESYQLFTGGSLNGQNIDAKAVFSYLDYGDRTQSKTSNKLWAEGYISQNTALSASVRGDLDAFETDQTAAIEGSDNSIVGFGSGAHALGKNNLGSQPLGGAQTTTELPSWFHVAKTYTAVPSYLESVSFESNGVDQKWELLAYGTNAQVSSEGNNAITQ